MRELNFLLEKLKIALNSHLRINETLLEDMIVIMKDIKNLQKQNEEFDRTNKESR